MHSNESTQAQASTELPMYALSLKGEGITVEREVDEAVALRVLAVVMGGAPDPPPAIQAPGKAHASGGPSTGSAAQSLREYLDEIEPKRNVDTILAIASYLNASKAIGTFVPDDVRREFRNASEPVPGNYARDFRWAVSNGWIAPADDMPGEYYVTSKGHQAVEAKFSDEVKKTTGVNKARRRRGRKKDDDA